MYILLYNRIYNKSIYISMIKGVIFDFDGVIVKSDESRYSILKNSLANVGYSLSKDEFRVAVGMRTKDFLQEIVGKTISAEEINKIYEELNNNINNNPRNYFVVNSGLLSLCKNLYKNSYKMAIASSSNTDNIVKALEILNLKEYFNVVIGSDLVDSPKPSPEVYLNAVEKLNLEISECIAIEDSPIGILSAKKAGLFCIAIKHSMNQETLSLADMVIESLDQIEEFLDM